MYGRPPPIHLPYLAGESKVDSVDRVLLNREEALQAIKLNLARAQNRMRQQTNKKRSDRNFEPGDCVYLKLQPYRQASIASRGNQKLVKRYYGPYKIMKKVWPVAYKLELPPTTKIHHNFYVSLLKKCHGDPPIPSIPLEEQGVAREP
ncbi:uncharacterized protein LOC141630835 [Silene latifolia]|uniref:uncharacterized protein LOC141630835 n=1 Tax=Silene latifolia TaxID=37657 RepID=UPI003D774670